jgi:hypothetical protein
MKLSLMVVIYHLPGQHGCNAGIPMPPEREKNHNGKAIQPRVANASKT